VFFATLILVSLLAELIIIIMILLVTFTSHHFREDVKDAKFVQYRARKQYSFYSICKT